MVMRGGDGSGSSSTGLKRSAYPWAVFERERVVRLGAVSLRGVLEYGLNALQFASAYLTGHSRLTLIKISRQRS